MATESLQEVKKEMQPEDRDWQLNKCLAECMLEMYERQLFTDVTFVFQQQVPDQGSPGKICAHKNILAARSPVFQAMFCGSWAESESIIEIQDIDMNNMDLFLRYTYSDHVKLEKETVVEVLKIAHKYQVPKLISFCNNFITKKLLSTENALSCLEIALLYDIVDLRDDLCSFIDEHGKEILCSGSFLQVSNDCLVYLLKGDTLEADEELIYERCYLWANGFCNKDEIVGPSNEIIRKTLGKAFYYIRIPTMDIRTFFRCTKRWNPFTYSEYERVVKKVSDEDVDVTSNYSKESRMLFEIICRKEKDASWYRPTKDIENKIYCSVELLLSRSCILKGLVLCLPKTDCKTESTLGMLLQLMTLKISVPELSYERLVCLSAGEVPLHIPLSHRTEKISICLEADLSVLTNLFQDLRRSSRHTNIYLKTETRDQDEQLTGRVGEVIFKAGHFFIDKLLFRHVSNREKFS